MPEGYNLNPSIIKKTSEISRFFCFKRVPLVNRRKNHGFVGELVMNCRISVKHSEMEFAKLYSVDEVYFSSSLKRTGHLVRFFGFKLLFI